MESSITQASSGLLYQPQMMYMEQSVECLAGETKVLGENLPQFYFVYHNLA
jgi:hypothetical protein